MKECPCCGYRDGIYWWPRIFEPGVDFARIPDIPNMDGQIIETKLAPFQRPILTPALKDLKWGSSKSILAEGPYIYKVTKGGVVHRVEKFLFDAQNGFAVGTDGAGTPVSAAFKKKISSRVSRETKETMQHAVSRKYSWIRAMLAKEQTKLEVAPNG